MNRAFCPAACPEPTHLGRSAEPATHRRLLLSVAVALTAVVSSPAFAQAKRRVPRIAIIAATSVALAREQVDALKDGLRELGYVDGQNIVIDERWAEGRPERFASLIADVQQSRVDVIVVAAATGARAAKQGVSSTPVVFVAVTDPVGGGVVESLARPGGNLTGTSLLIGEELAGKLVGLAKEALPGLSRVAVLADTSHPVTPAYLSGMESVAREVQARLVVFKVTDAAGLETVLSDLPKASPDALIATASPLFGSHRKKITQLALAGRIPTIGYDREFVTVGALLSYGPSITDAYRRGAKYVDRILKGAKPADLPVEQSTQFELVVNLRVARTLGLTIPRAFLMRADSLLE